MAETGEIITERRGRALWITIDREERRNALNGAVIEGLHAALLAADADPAVRVIVLTGAGRKAFCAGADLGGGAAVFGDDADRPTTGFGRLARAMREVGKPVVARVNGACVAGGMGLMAMCDLAVVADHAQFGLPEARVGVFPMQVLVYLRGMMHPRHVNELCLTGAMIDAARAREMGIANEVVPYEGLDAAVERTVARLCEMSPVALRRGKHVIAAMQSMDFAEALAFAEGQIALVARTDDAAEGLAAFNEKRKPRWATDDDEQG